jgi:hypothetical protein
MIRFKLREIEASTRFETGRGAIHPPGERFQSVFFLVTIASSIETQPIFHEASHE